MTELFKGTRARRFDPHPNLTLEQALEFHYPVTVYAELICAGCAWTWPCDSFQLAQMLKAERQARSARPS